MKDSIASDSAELGNRSFSGMSLVWLSCVLFLRIRVPGVPLFFVVCPKTRKIPRRCLRVSGKDREPTSPKLYEFDSYIFTHSNEFAGKTIVEPEGETEKNKLTIYVRMSSGKTISIKCD